MNKFLIPSVILFIVAGGAYYTLNSFGGREEGEPLPELSFTNYAGETVSFADFQGKPLVINSWAAWCPFCRKELPDFASVADEYRGRVEILAIDRAESLDVAKQYTDELGVTDKLAFLLDPNDAYYKAIDAFAMPETVFVSRDGLIVDRFRGPMSKEVLREKIEELLRR